jgi:hypothetical protein
VFSGCGGDAAEPWVKVTTEMTLLRLGQDIAPDKGEEHEARERGEARDCRKRLHEPRAGPSFEEFLDAKRGDDRAVWIAFPTEALRVEGETREEEARDGEKHRHGPVVDRFVPTVFEISAWEGSL